MADTWANKAAQIEGVPMETVEMLKIVDGSAWIAGGMLPADPLHPLEGRGDQATSCTACYHGGVGSSGCP